ncbi:MAG: 4Fe-4S ferredoxin [Planctomycetes bacterium GWF2_50_10]|nr:MAG: 4Fe-4S ferredoxin [Planctomycetes bacterium GWF2_50_10]
MATRNIVKIDEEKCNGCGDCVTACAEGAIAIIDGKAKLVSETYCDGLGACLGHCPMDAIHIEQRESAEFNEDAVKKHLAQSTAPAARRFAGGQGGGCPSMVAHTFEQKPQCACDCSGSESAPAKSTLGNWPVQIKLVSPNAPFLKNADVLLAGDCVPFAMPDFHSKVLAGKALLVGCPKLDDGQFYVDKLAEIFKNNVIKSLTVIHMEVPCCFGLRRIAEMAMERAGKEISIIDVTVSLEGKQM